MKTKYRIKVVKTTNKKLVYSEVANGPVEEISMNVIYYPMYKKFLVWDYFYETLQKLKRYNYEQIYSNYKQIVSFSSKEECKNFILDYKKKNFKSYNKTFKEINYITVQDE